MNAMTELQRCQTVLAGGMADRVPVVPQSFLFALECAGVKMCDAVRNPRRMAEALALTQAEYGYDGCVIDFDTVTMAEALGAKVHFRDNEPTSLDDAFPPSQGFTGCGIVDSAGSLAGWTPPDLAGNHSSFGRNDRRPGFYHGTCRPRTFQPGLSAAGTPAIHDGPHG